MAPTELLADQHAQNFSALVRTPGSGRGAPDGRQTGKARSAVLNGIREGHAAIVVGTHACSGARRILALALVIVDEQHRFACINA